MKWGTSNPIMLRDQDFGIVRLRAFGAYSLRVADPSEFIKQVAERMHIFRPKISTAN
jgi:membrane protease subunit (stomatin/prohibitin family)